MMENKSGENNFVGYEYKDITAKREMESVYADGYRNFGWELEGTSSSVVGVGSVTLKFKRDRKVRNKAELTRLQRQFDACVSAVEALERSKVLGPSALAYGLGLVGTAFMAGSVFAYLGGLLPLCIVLAVPGFLGWILPYLCYRTLGAKKSAKVTPLIDQKYDEIYEVCEKANGLLVA